METVRDVRTLVAARPPILPPWAAAAIGIVAGAVALGVAQLAAGVLAPEAAPVAAVGGVAVDLSPAPLKEWAIRTFGENDKTVLLAGIVVVLAAIAAALGVLSQRSPRYGTTGLLLFGVVGAVAAMTRPAAGVIDVVPSLVGALAGSWALTLLLRRATPVADLSYAYESRTYESHAYADRPEALQAPDTEEDDGEPGRRDVERPPVMVSPDHPYAIDRRGLLTGAVAGLAVAGATGFAGGALSGSRQVDTARTTLTLPRPARPAAPLPAGADLRIRGLAPFVTPTADFYRVDTALIIPRVDPADWTLRVHGMVDRPIEITFDQLIRRPLIEADVTLTCVSNEVGGPYIGNARWLGASMADLLREAGIKSGADMLLSTSADGWTCGTPVDVVLDGRDALFAVAMNGEALPVQHGFPARQVVPGLYGYVSATKWVTEIKVTRFDQDEGYWTPRGWSAKGPIKTQSRIDVPAYGASVKPGRTTIAGVAWAQHKGVAAVEVRVDDGPWRQARLAEVPGPDTWRQWVIDDWDATPGSHRIQVRATDAAGYTQTEELAEPAPDGATGRHSISVTVG
ncbi:molybdopterin-dependent oxidoreductase [Thermopolyspora sp. NPDC052614]|uniref:molybdopterin-dependent oxidoreductase n=1 Tax=Thermopolyspora sp. NPDC052614 TaxID=3155682 RepID=UPI00342EE69B